MEGGALFDPGFLGGQFLWWVGQIPDDATWRDNINPGKYPDKDGQSGWGRRYKVRIIGVHDKTEESIPSDQLPWAQVMYPITAGSGAANAWQTPQIRQGNFVFGFFMDGPDQQVPVIMGILGNNPQTQLKLTIGTTEDNYSGVSGFAQSQDPPKPQAIPSVPDGDKTIVKPKTPEMQQEQANHNPPGTVLNKYGLRRDKEQTAAQFKDVQSALQAAQDAGLNPEETTQRVKDAVAAGRDARLKFANSPLSPPQPGATLESGASSPHITSAAALVQDHLYKVKTPLMKPDGKVESSQKCIQTVLDNLADKTKLHLAKVSDYSIAVSNKIPDMEPEIKEAAKEIAKFEKVSIDKMMEYSLKSLNAAAAPTMASMPAAGRFEYTDVMSGFTQKLAEDYLGITNGLADTVMGILNTKLNLPAKEKAAKEAAKSLPKDEKDTHVKVDICTSEEIIGETMALQKEAINKANNNMVKNMDLFLSDMASQVAGLAGSLEDMKNQLPPIQGSVTSALQFDNLLANVFPFELPPTPAVSDFYTMAEGSGAQSDAMTPSPLAIDKIANKVAPNIPSITEVPFAEPFKNQPTIDLVKNTVENMDASAALDAAAKVSPQAAAAKAAINIAQGQSVQDAAKDAALDIYGA